MLPQAPLFTCVCFHCSGSVLVYMIDTTTGSMQLSHKLELTPKHYPGTAPPHTPLPPALHASSSACLCPSSRILRGESSHSFSCLPHGNTSVFPLSSSVFVPVSVISPEDTAPPSGGASQPINQPLMSHLPGSLECCFLNNDPSRYLKAFHLFPIIPRYP